MTSSLPFYLHALIETPASLNFFLNPAAQLPPAVSTLAPEAQASLHFVIRQYAVLLFSSVLIALVFATRSVVDGTGRKVAGALAVYHAAPLARAVWRITETQLEGGLVIGDGKGGGLGGPWLHALVHALALLGLGSLPIWGQQKGIKAVERKYE